MSLVPGYGSSSESEGDAPAAAPAAAPEARAAKRARPAPTYTGNFFEGGAASSSEEESDEDDVGEEERRAAQAAPPPPASGLPSVSELFSAVDGPPAFLRPDATRPIAVIETHPHATAPPLHPVLGGGDRRADAAVIGAAPQRYSAEEAAKREALSALRREAEAAEAALAQTQAAEAAAAAAPRRDFRSKAVPVSDALANPSLNLPRDKQERKDRERAKRERGQSAIGSWKSEAEMVLRQQYDS